MVTIDVYRITDKLDDATLEVVETRLEARGKHPRFIEMMEDYLDAMRSRLGKPSQSARPRRAGLCERAP